MREPAGGAKRSGSGGYCGLRAVLFLLALLALAVPAAQVASATASKPVVSVSVNPTSASVQVSQTANFTASVQNDRANKGVSWSLSGAGCSGNTCGTLTSVTTTSVTYNAPASVPSPATVTLTATSIADGTRSAAATITVTALPPISVSVNPTSASVQVSQTANFTASVLNDPANKGVSWSLSGSGCSGNTCGTLTSVTTTSVTYNAPASVPSPATVTLTATSIADGTKSAAATITVTAPPPISVSVNPTSASVQVSQTANFTASVLNDPANKGVNWSLSGAGCSGITCGTLTSVTTTSVTYNAPASVPSPATVTLTATSIADGTKSAAATITVTAPPPISVSVNPTSASVQVSQTANFTASVLNDSTNKGVSWSLSGTGCSGNTCGTLTSVTTTSVTYNAPASVPSPATVTLTATSIADGTKSAAATITVTAPPPISVSVNPTSASVQVSQTANFTASVLNDPANKGVNWSLSGAGCSGNTCGTLTSITTTSVTYNAPASVPSPATVTLTATSIADGTTSAAATITVTSVVAPVLFVRGAATDGFGTSIREGYASNTAGNLLIVSSSWDSVAASATISDTAGNTWTAVFASPVFQPNGSYPTRNQIWYARNCKGSAGVNTVTLTYNVSTSFADIEIHEYSGADTTNPLDLSASSAPATDSANPSLTTGTTNFSNELVFGMVAISTGTPVAGTGYTLREQAGNTFTATEDANVTATGAQTVRFTNGLSTWALLVATFRAATGGGGSPPISVSVNPTSASVQISQTANFTASVLNDSANKGVNWSLSGAGCSGITCGTLTSVTTTSVTYNAPGSVPNPATVTLTATSIADGTKSAAATITVTATPPPISVSVNPTSASVQVSQTANFTASVLNDSTNKGVSWSLSGTGCSGNTCGTLTSVTTTSVTYNAPASVPSPATVTLTATSIADGTKSAAATITVTPSGTITVTISPLHAELTTSQTRQFTATVTGTSNQGVTWWVDGVQGGSATVGTITAAGLFTPGTASGRHNVTAQSVVNGASSAPSVVAVTDLAGVFTWRNDNTRAGVNSQEYALDTTNVNAAKFGKLFSCTVDGQVYAQPLYAANVAIPSQGTHNVIYVATMHDSVYALDADAASCQQLWFRSFINPPSVTTVPSADLPTTDISPEIGILGTPVIDPASQTLFLVARTKEVGGSNGTYVQRLHALDITTGQERTGSPVVITASVTGTGASGGASCPSQSGQVVFCPLTQNQRLSLSLLNGLVYVGWGAHDQTDPNHGWLIAYNASGLQQATVFNDTPNGQRGGIWMSGAGPAIDASGNIYFSTADGSFDWDGKFPPVAPFNDFADSVIKLSTGGGSLSIADFFTPFDQLSLQSNNTDMGSSGVVLLPDFAPPGPTHMLIAAGKEGKLFLIDRDNMGKINNPPNGPDLVLQSIFFTNGGFFGSPTFWNNTFYGGPAASPISALTFNPATKQFNTAQPPPPTSQSFLFPGASPVISALGTSNGILWAIDSSAYELGGGPTVLYAYDATNLSHELYDTTQAAGNRDQAGLAVKFTVPTVANGRVYVGTQGILNVYGLLP